MENYYEEVKEGRTRNNSELKSPIKYFTLDELFIIDDTVERISLKCEATLDNGTYLDVKWTPKVSGSPILLILSK